MEEKALLEAINQMMAQQKNEILQAMDVKLNAAEQRISKSTVTLMDAEFKERFNLLAEGQEAILEKMPTDDDLDIIDGRLSTLEAIAKKHSKEIEGLKKAN